MPIPQSFPSEPENEYISRCMSAISDEYDNKQAYAICKNSWDKSQGLSLNKWKDQFLYETDLQQRVKELFKNKTK
jgi:hypothetical protein